ncbi:hypothetical protein [Helicobacter sp. MIT 14-3879]|uniref:hypothetical protein n=1 Tax=Helicobacter sp. MIT 14-3879 TaxID=2040649 RepID=UPI000E1F2EE5|nr:hypothetical protein [Helicobacter sp. MIT 14-3879]RDU65650.1 hypothetical protein CQA44_01325 [Helicobacter sp. MIT 14-3879]
MDKKILDFLLNNHLLSLSVLENSDSSQKRQLESKYHNFIEYEVYTASCYYAFDKVNLSFIIKSSPNSKHIQLAYKNPILAINISEDSMNIANIKGAQIKAIFMNSTKEQKDIYYNTFPFAILYSGELYTLKIAWVKYTHNALNKKIFFEA